MIASPRLLGVRIAEIIEEAGFSVDEVDDNRNAAAIRVKRWVAEPPSRLSLAAYVDSIPLSLEYESIRGEETEAAQPLDAETA